LENFDEDRWLEHHVDADKTSEGKVLVSAINPLPRIKRRYLYYQMGRRPEGDLMSSN